MSTEDKADRVHGDETLTSADGGQQEVPPQHTMPSIRVRIVQIIFLIAAVAATLFLAHWQWDRYTSDSGTAQNLGYVLQWPAIGAFFIIAYRKYLQYERELAEGKAAPGARRETSRSRRKGSSRKGATDTASRKNDAPMREIPEDFLPQRSRPQPEQTPENPRKTH